MSNIQLVHTSGSFRLAGIVTHHKMCKLVIRGGCEHDTLQQCYRSAHRNTGNSVRTLLLISDATLSGKIPTNITWDENLDLSQAAGNNEQHEGEFRCSKSLDFRLMSYFSYNSAPKESALLNRLERGLVPTFFLIVL